MIAGTEIKIEEVVGANTDEAWIIQLYPTDKDKAVASNPAEAIFILARKMGFDKVTLEGCYDLVDPHRTRRREAIMASRDQS
jgi:hypothetical protein